VVWAPRASAAGLGLQRLAPRRGALGEALQRVGEAFALALDVEHVAAARRVAPGDLLPGAQALARIGDRVVGPQSLLGGVEQVHASGIRVATPLRSQDVAVGRRGIDAGQHGRGTLEDLVVQAHPNAGQVLVVVDDARLPRGRLLIALYPPGHVLHGGSARLTQKIERAPIKAVIYPTAEPRLPAGRLRTVWHAHLLSYGSVENGAHRTVIDLPVSAKELQILLGTTARRCGGADRGNRRLPFVFRACAVMRSRRARAVARR